MTPTVTVTLSLSDAIAVGATLRSLAATGRPHPSACLAMTRVGSQLVSAAQAELVGATIAAAEERAS